MNIKYHKELAAGRWFKLSLAEQLGNIGSEVSRSSRWQNKDEKLFWGAYEKTGIWSWQMEWFRRKVKRRRKN